MRGKTVSRPAWARGLKLIDGYMNFSGFLSRPAWARGLKRQKLDRAIRWVMSRPAWARGLKLDDGAPVIEARRVAPRVGAWIETR